MIWSLWPHNSVGFIVNSSDIHLDFTPSSGGHGLLVLYRQHGAAIARGRTCGCCKRQRIDGCKHWHKPEEGHPQALVQPSMYQNLLLICSEHWGGTIHKLPNYHHAYPLYWFRSLQSLISALRRNHPQISFPSTHDDLHVIFSYRCSLKLLVNI